MASRKLKGPSPQMGLSLPTSARDPLPGLPQGTAVVAAIASADLGPTAFDLDELDDYDESALVDSVPRLRLADPVREITVIVEANRDGFWVSRLRHDGTTVASVQWTRKELEELIMRAQSALEVG